MCGDYLLSEVTQLVMSWSWAKCVLKTKPTISVLNYRRSKWFVLSAWVMCFQKYDDGALIFLAEIHEVFFFHSICCFSVRMVPLILSAKSVPDFESWCPLVHVWEEVSVSFTAKVCFYEWESFILFLRMDCISHRTGHAHFQVFVLILLQEFWLSHLS